MSTRDLVDDILAALAAGDFDRYASFFAEDCVLEYPGDNDMSGVYRGRKGLREHWDKLGRFLPELSTKVRTLAVDGPIIAMEYEDVGRAKDGRPYEGGGAVFMEVEDGKVVRAREYMDTAKMATIFR